MENIFFETFPKSFFLTSGLAPTLALDANTVLERVYGRTVGAVLSIGVHIYSLTHSATSRDFK